MSQVNHVVRIAFLPDLAFGQVCFSCKVSFFSPLSVCFCATSSVGIVRGGQSGKKKLFLSKLLFI